MDFENPGLEDWALRVVRQRCPDHSVEELEEAANNLLSYMEVVWDIYQRLKSEGRIEEVMARAQAEREQRFRLLLIGDLVSLLSFRATKTSIRATHDSKPRNA